MCQSGRCAHALCSCSRAYLKIEEAFAALGLAELPAGTAAIDLGEVAPVCTLQTKTPHRPARQTHITVFPSPSLDAPILSD